MAKQLEDLWDNVPGFDPDKGEFRRLGLDQWLKENRVVEQARADGEQNKPSVGEARAGVPDKIIGWVNRRGRICRQNVSKWLNNLERNLADMEDVEGLEQRKQEVQVTLEDAKLDLERKKNGQRNDLAVQQREVRDANHDYEEFRRESRLRRLPDHKGRKSALVFILIFFFLEIGLNAMSLMDVNPFGLMGAMGLMAAICAVNILIMGVFMGVLLRLIHHVQPMVRWPCVLLALFTVSLVGGFNVMVGHLRDSMQAILDDPSADVFAVGADTFVRFSEGYIAFDSFQSALLALLGFLFFCVASWKWLDRDDRYPGYGKKHRMLQEKQDDYKSRYEIAADILSKEYKNYEDKLKDVLQRLVMQQTRWREHRVQGSQVVADFPTNLKQYQHDMNQLLGAYFRANRAERSEPEPDWFSETVEIDKELLVPPDFNVPEQTSLKSVADLVKEAIGELQDFYRELRKEIPTLEEAMTNTNISQD